MDTTSRKGLHLYYCGHEACSAGHSFGPAERQHYLIHFILRGKGIYEVNGRKYSLEKGSAFLIRPRELTFYQADFSDPWEYMWVAFDGEEANRLLREYRLNETNYICRLRDTERTAAHMRELIANFSTREASFETLLGHFYLAWSGMEHPDVTQTFAGELDYLKRACRYMEHNYTYPLRIDEIARYIGIDRTYLYRIFIHYKGISPKQYLTDCRIKAAADMLLCSSLSVTEIALSCGFPDSASFSRQFRKQKGTTPIQFRGRRKTPPSG